MILVCPEKYPEVPGNDVLHAGRSGRATGRGGLLRKFSLFAAVTGLLVIAGGATGFSRISTAAMAQETTPLASTPAPDSNAQMLLEADNVTYDNDAQIVVATGNVQIVYNDYTLVADEVTYDRKSGRVIARGSVEIAEPGGNRIHAGEIDVTDDFRDGFVSALNVETADETHIAAESAERINGNTTRFKNGVYTACKPCENIKGHPPMWQIRARTVTIDNATRRVSYEDATFELFGKPIAYLPYFSHAEPSAKRKTGFLMPGFSNTDKLGFLGKLRYYLNLAPNYDLTLDGGYYTEQGFIGEAEWRHLLENGQYNLRVAGINQQSPDNFSSNTVDYAQDSRIALMTRGDFELNSRWDLGWDWLYQTDTNFARTYNLADYNVRDIENQVHLTGIGDKNYFDLRGQQFLVQDNLRDVDLTVAGDQTYTDQQGAALPSFDYNVVSDQSVWGGQVGMDLNVTNIKRNHGQVAQNYITEDGQVVERFDAKNYGVKGDYVRASAKAEWTKSEVVGNGLLFNLTASGQVDSINYNADNAGFSPLYDTNPLGTAPGDITSNDTPLLNSDSLYRAMPVGMMEIRYPMVASSGGVSHIFEPIGQVIVRPDETLVGQFPNEDAQSMVFDTSNLFAINKFSGYDRVEGGTRANVGFRYSASFEDGSTLNVVAGQSFHLAGKNSYAQRDLVNAGLESGLETDRSDYVASVNFENTSGFGIGAFGRFDESDFSVRRTEANARYLDPKFSISSSYIFIASQPNYGVAEDRHEIGAAASLRLNDNWRAFGALNYDIENDNTTSRTIGLAYDNECTSFSVAYSNDQDRYTGTETGRRLLFNIGLRTLGKYGYEYNLLNNGQDAENTSELDILGR